MEQCAVIGDPGEYRNGICNIVVDKEGTCQNCPQRIQCEYSYDEEPRKQKKIEKNVVTVF